MDRQHHSSDELHRTRDSLKSKIQSLKDAMSSQITAEVDEANAVKQAMGQGDASHGHHGPGSDLISRVRHDAESIPLPSTDSFVVGGLQVPVGTHHAGTAATVNGDLDVFGTVDGNAVAVGGDVVLHPGSHVAGSAFAAGGEVRMEGTGGTVDGEIRSLEGPFGRGAIAGTAPTTVHGTRMHALRIAIASFLLLIILGFAVLTFAEEHLNHVTATVVDRFGRSAWYGVVGEIATLPVFLVLTVGLAITIIGLLAIPFATIGYFVVVAGAATLGFVAVAEATGTALLRTRGQSALTPRGAQLRAIVVGISVYGGLWMLTALVGADSAVGVTVRGVAVVITGVAATAGFGAVLLWLMELRRARRLSLGAPVAPPDQAAWVTPTPVTGVAAARRPTPPASSISGSST